MTFTTETSQLTAATTSGRLLLRSLTTFKKELNDIDMDERVMRQRKLVELNSSLFPQSIVKTFDYFVADNVDKGHIQANNIKLDNILEGTKFLSKDFRKPKQNSIFDNLKDLDKFIKPVSTSLF